MPHHVEELLDDQLAVKILEIMFVLFCSCWARVCIHCHMYNIFTVCPLFQSKKLSLTTTTHFVLSTQLTLPWTAKAASFTKGILQSTDSSHFRVTLDWKHTSENIQFMITSGREGIGGPFWSSWSSPPWSVSRGHRRSSIERLGNCMASTHISMDINRRTRYCWIYALRFCLFSDSCYFRYTVQCDRKLTADLGESPLRWLAEEARAYPGDARWGCQAAVFSDQNTLNMSCKAPLL